MADQLREEAKSLIKDNVHKQLFWLAKRFFVIFGVTNFTVIVAAFFWIRENLPDIPELKEQAEAAAQRVAEDTARNEVSNLVRSNIGAYSNAVSAQADVIVQSLVETSAQAGSIRKDIVGLQRQAEQLKLIISELSIEAENQSMEVKTINDKISQASVEGIDSVLSKLGDNAIRAAVEAGERLSIIQEKSEDMEKAIAALTGRLQNLQKDGASKKIHARAVVKPYTCDPSANNRLIGCNGDEYNLGVVLYDTSVGGACGQGGVYNICVKK